MSSRDYSSGKLLDILVKLRNIPCEKPRMGLPDYTFSHRIYVARQGEEVVGMIAWRRIKVQPPEEPEKDVIVIDTLCAKDDSVKEELMKTVPVIQYPTGASPGFPSGYTTEYNYEAEGDPKGLLLPAAAVDAVGGAGVGNYNRNNNYDNYNSNKYNSNGNRINKSRVTNFTKKTEGRSAFFPKLTVKTGGRRRRSSRRRRVMSRRQP